MKIYKSPKKYPKNGIKIFLGGSIEMGACDDWQEELTSELSSLDISILNPRRDDFDITQEQSIHNPYFKKQVEWELQALEDSDVIVMYLDPATKAPISMMELGLFKDKRILVCCPEGFWRKGNIEIVCARYDLTLFHTKQKLFKYCKDILE
jgi:hypothetical protein